MTTAPIPVHPDQTPAPVREPANPAGRPGDSDAESADGWSTEQDDGSFAPVQVPPGRFPSKQESSA